MIFPELGPHDILSASNNLFSIKGIMDDIVNTLFGKWTVIAPLGRNDKGERIYSCQCKCGILKDHALGTLKLGRTTQCKACSIRKRQQSLDLIGKTFGSWSVTGKTKNEIRNEWYYDCICKCGTTKKISGHHLKSGSTTKCHKCRVKTHGMSYTDTFKIWTGILRRCKNPNFKAYPRYGGRGISICDRWLVFQNFLQDMGKRPYGLQIDRIDNDGNYEPGNCRWVTPRENNANKGSKKIISLKKGEIR